jgi:uncharacterized FlaG/YvyC family protein
MRERFVVNVPAVSAIPPSTGESNSSDQSRRVLANAVAAINNQSAWPGRLLKIHVDPMTRHVTIQVVNSETEEVLDQIPSELVLRMASELPKETGASNSDNSTF